MNYELRIKNLEFFTAEIVLENDGGGYLVNQSFVLTGFLLQTTVEHRLMGQYGGESLVVVLDGHLGNGFPPTGNKLLHTLQIITRLTIGLSGFANDDPLQRLFSPVGLQPIE